MAVTVHQAQLVDLAGVVDDHDCAVSVHIDLDPSHSPTAGDVHARVHGLLDQAARIRRRARMHADRNRLAANIDRLWSRLSGDPKLGLPEGRKRGAAGFAWGDREVAVVALPHAVEDRVEVGRRLSLTEAASQRSRTSDVLILVASREEGHLMRYVKGRLVDVFDDREPQERRHDQGGWAQMILQRWVDNAGRRHLQAVVEHLVRVHAPMGRPPLILAADDAAAATVDAAIDQEVRRSLVGRVGNERDRTVGELIDQAEAIMIDRDRSFQRDLVQRWRAATESPGGHGTHRMADTLAAVSDGRVDWLLKRRRDLPPAYSCPTCGRLYAEPGHCPADGDWLPPDQDGDAVVAETLVRGGSVWRLLEADDPSLDSAGGLAALTRY